MLSGRLATDRMSVRLSGGYRMRPPLHPRHWAGLIARDVVRALCRSNNWPVYQYPWVTLVLTLPHGLGIGQWHKQSGVMRDWWVLPDQACSIADSEQVRGWVLSFLRKPVDQADGPQLPAQAHDEWLATTCPALHEWLTAVQWPDGTARQTSRLSLWFEGRECRGYLRDQDTQHLLWGVADTLAGLLVALDDQLQSDAPQWRQDRYRTGTTARVKPTKKP